MSTEGECIDAGPKPKSIKYTNLAKCELSTRALQELRMNRKCVRVVVEQLNRKHTIKIRRQQPLIRG